jgi:hypothetical protein
MGQIAYVIGPYAANEGRTESMNVTRAVALGSLALAHGLVPIIPHVTLGCSALLLGDHGHPDADKLARDASYGPYEKSGLANFLGNASPVLRVCVFLLLQDDRRPSKGTAIELGLVGGPFRHPLFQGTWEDWRRPFGESGLSSLYEAATTGTTFPRWPGDARP